MRPNKLNDILAFVGVSGGGKTSLMRALVNADPNRFNVLVSTATRPRRGNADDDAGHCFVSLSDMKGKMANNEIWCPVEYPPGSNNWYGVQKRHAEETLSTHIGVIAFVESVVEGYRKEGFTVRTVNVVPVNKELDFRGDPARAAADAARAAKPFNHDFVLENDFSPGGFDRSLAQLLEFVARL